MNTRERILTIRLLEKVTKCPAYAEALGIEGENVTLCPDYRANSGAIGKRRKSV